MSRQLPISPLRASLPSRMVGDSTRAAAEGSAARAHVFTTIRSHELVNLAEPPRTSQSDRRLE
jgi:hypothetical protein